MEKEKKEMVKELPYSFAWTEEEIDNLVNKGPCSITAIFSKDESGKVVMQVTGVQYIPLEVKEDE